MTDAHATALGFDLTRLAPALRDAFFGGRRAGPRGRLRDPARVRPS